jgi:hypothetical protein
MTWAVLAMVAVRTGADPADAGLAAPTPVQCATAEWGQVGAAPIRLVDPGNPGIRPRRPLALGNGSSGLMVDPVNREESRCFYNLVYRASEGVSMEWTGDYEEGKAGATSPMFQEAIARRVQYFRAMAGVPADLVMDPVRSGMCQEAALIMSVNRVLSHLLTPDLLFYTAGGAEAALNSNISLGHYGPEAVDGYLEDSGLNNSAAGHRRWLLYPQTKVMATGDVPAQGGFIGGNCLWVIDLLHLPDARPLVRDGFVSWPPPGYVPENVVYPRWSFSYAGADFGGATVLMTSNGVPQEVELEPVQQGFGEESLVWVPRGMPVDCRTTNYFDTVQDTVYHIRIQGALVEGIPRDWEYTVTVFDPACPGPDRLVPAISGPDSLRRFEPGQYSLTEVQQASGYEWRQGQLALITWVEGAEGGGTRLEPCITEGYSAITSARRASGFNSFHLAQPEPVSQVLRFRASFIPGPGAALVFSSLLAYATPGQVARVQVSLDGGIHWQDVFRQSGSSGAQTYFSEKTVDLSPFQGQVIQLRFNYDYAGGAYYPQTDGQVGWFIDQIRLRKVEELIDPKVNELGSARSFGYSSSAEGRHLLQARARLFGQYPGEWSQPSIVSVAGALGCPPRILGWQRLMDDQWRIRFLADPERVGGYVVQSAPSVSGPWQEVGEAVITAGPLPGEHEVRVTALACGERFFRVGCR